MNKYKWAAYDLFRPMRSSTIEEQESYYKMLEKHCISIEKIDIFMDKLIKDSNKDGTKLYD